MPFNKKMFSHSSHEFKLRAVRARALAALACGGACYPRPLNFCWGFVIGRISIFLWIFLTQFIAIWFRNDRRFLDVSRLPHPKSESKAAKVQSLAASDLLGLSAASKPPP